MNMASRPMARKPKSLAKKGSEPCCRDLVHGSKSLVAARLAGLVQPWASVTETDAWMPSCFRGDEAELHKNMSEPLLNLRVRQALGKWWLPADRQSARSPNWDLASTTDGKRGLLLVEPKAHSAELKQATKGRPLANTPGQRASEATISRAIEQARVGLSAATNCDWHLSHRTHYQMCNRFAWAWKLAALGKPVILAYLGFLGAEEPRK